MQPSDRLNYRTNTFDNSSYEMDLDNRISDEIMEKAKKLFEKNGKGISTRELKNKLDITDKQCNIIMDKIASEILKKNKHK